MHIFVLQSNIGTSYSFVTLFFACPRFSIKKGKPFYHIVKSWGRTRRIWRIPLNHSMSELFYKLDLSRNRNQYVFKNPKNRKTHRGFQTKLAEPIKAPGHQRVRVQIFACPYFHWGLNGKKKKNLFS